MIHSLASKYQEVVRLVPVHQISAEIIHFHFLETLKILKDCRFNTIVTICDNHCVNRQFFKILSGGSNVKSRIVHPLSNELSMFLLIDPVHSFRNLYNNFLNKSQFRCPDPNNITGDQWISPSFNHVRQLFDMEKINP